MSEKSDKETKKRIKEDLDRATDLLVKAKVWREDPHSKEQRELREEWKEWNTIAF